ncbi:MAG: hypothetical protein KC964_02885, partial [Candidatus Omnitrophica bacterium]|nr:hypothetical protein [Candidatus Omnitrophota bacterium]
GGSGLIRTYGENGNYNAEIGWDRLTPPTEDNDKNHGAIALFDEDQDDRVKLLINSDSAGALILDGSNGNGNVILGGTDGFPDFGRIAVLNSDGETSASLSAGRYGFLDMFGENGSKSVRIGGTISHPDEGAVLLSDDQGEERASLQVDSEGAGELVLDGPNGNRNVVLGPNVTPDYGRALFFDSDGEEKVLLGASNSGFMILYGPNGNPNVQIEDSESDQNNGKVALADSQGSERAKLEINSDGLGELLLDGPNGNPNVRIWRDQRDDTSDFHNSGGISLYGDQGISVAEFYVSGSNHSGSLGLFNTGGVTQTIYLNGHNGGVVANSFLELKQHPLKTNTPLVYSAVSSRQPTLIHSGVARLEGGRARVDLPEDFVALAEPGSLVVNLSPASLNSKGVAFEIPEHGSLQIGELNGGAGSYDVHYTVTALEVGQADYKTELTQAEYEKRFDLPKGNE